MMTSIGPKAQGNSIKRAALTGSLLRKSKRLRAFAQSLLTAWLGILANYGHPPDIWSKPVGVATGKALVILLVQRHFFCSL